MDKSVVLVVDCWDKHWDDKAQKTLDEGCPKINKFLNKMRDKGSLIIHCPSNVAGDNRYVEEIYEMDRRDKLSLMKELQDNNFPMVLDADGPRVWSKQHDSIDINDKDFIVTRGNQVYNIIKQNNIETLYYVGYHANICLLWTRPFSIMQMKNNFDGEIYLIEDLTDWFGEYTDKVIDFYNKFICKIINSKEAIA